MTKAEQQKLDDLQNRLARADRELRRLRKHAVITGRVLEVVVEVVQMGDAQLDEIRRQVVKECDAGGW